MSSPRIIVSCASYPARITSVASVMRCMLNQTVRPDKVVLRLCEMEFGGRDGLPTDLLALQERGLEIRWTSTALKPHSKYFFALQEHPDDIVITVDDDVLYPLDLIQRLLQFHCQFPGAIIADATHLIIRDGQRGGVAPYREWPKSQTRYIGERRFDLLALGVGGVLYPPSLINTPPLFDFQAIREHCLMADDLWLFMHEQLMDIPVVAANPYPGFAYVAGSQETGLFHANLESNGNDLVLADLMDTYPEFKQALERHLVHMA